MLSNTKKELTSIRQVIINSNNNTNNNFIPPNENLVDNIVLGLKESSV